MSTILEEMAEANLKLCDKLKELELQNQDLRLERDELIASNEIKGILARQLLWLAYVWNDHNYKDEHFYIKGACESVGINSFEDANRFVEKGELGLLAEIQAKAVEDDASFIKHYENLRGVENPHLIVAELLLSRANNIRNKGES